MGVLRVLLHGMKLFVAYREHHSHPLRSGFAASTFPAGASDAANTRLGLKHFLAGTLKTSQKASVYPGFQVYREIKPVEVKCQYCTSLQLRSLS